MRKWIVFLMLVVSTMAMAQVKVQVKGVCPSDLDTVYIYDLNKRGVSQQEVLDQWK